MDGWMDIDVKICRVWDMERGSESEKDILIQNKEPGCDHMWGCHSEASR